MKDLLSENRINEFLGEDFADLFSVTVLRSVDSTNSYLKKLAVNGTAEFSVVAADCQTDGRGRLGRSFFSPDGSGVYMSVLLRPQKAVRDVLSVTTVAAVSVCEALDALGVRGHGIKWVNDIYLDGRKICGILAEGSICAGSDKPEYIVLGTGVNLYKPENGFPDDIADRAGAVFDTQEDGLKSRFIALFLKSFYEYYSGRKDGYADEYVRRSCITGKKVTVIFPGGERQAVVTGFTDACEICVEYGDGTSAVLSSGEISVSLFSC